MTAVIAWNQALFARINDLARHTPSLHPLAAGFATYGVLLFGALLLLALWQLRGAKDARLATALWAGAGTLLAVGVAQPLAALVAEPRPYLTHPSALLLVASTTDWSFPSDHATMAGACAAGLLLASRRIGLAALAAALVMAADRVYVGAHYPADVVAGLLLGAAVAAGGWFVLRVPVVALTGRLRRLPVVATWWAPPPPREVTAR